MLTPVKSVSLQFTSDGTSTALSFDLTTAPVSIDMTGQQVMGVLTPAVTAAGQAVAITGATVAGTVVTVQFPAAPPQLDGNQALLVYTLTFLLQFTE